jgi:hypothetical protein
LKAFHDILSGAATGTRYLARNLGLIDTAAAGANYFPGQCRRSHFRQWIL